MAQNPALQRSAKDLDRQDSSSSISPSKKDFTTNEFGVGFAGQDTRTNTAVFHQGTIAVLSAAVGHVQQCFKFIPSDATPVRRNSTWLPAEPKILQHNPNQPKADCSTGCCEGADAGGLMIPRESQTSCLRIELSITFLVGVCNCKSNWPRPLTVSSQVILISATLNKAVEHSDPH